MRRALPPLPAENRRTLNPKPLRAGDVVQLIALGYGEPDGPCTVVADQEGTGGLVWFAASAQSSPYRGPCEVARRQALRVIRRVQP